MEYKEAFKLLNNGSCLYVNCPDNIEREVWGYNSETGDLFVHGWEGNVWMNCSSGKLKAEFE